MYLKRKVDAFLEEWKADKNRKPLIVKGSRQIGKTESILHFAADHYENVIEINFVRDEKYKESSRTDMKPLTLSRTFHSLTRQRSLCPKRR